MSTIITIVVASVVGFKYAVTEIKEVVMNQVEPIIHRIERIERSDKNNDKLLAIVIDHTNSNTQSIEDFIIYYNKTYHKEFLVPTQITINDLKDIKEE